MKYRKVLLIFTFLMIILVSFLFLRPNKQIMGIVMGGKTYFVETAITEKERDRGLSLHVPLQDNQGMLFVFQKEDFYGFWMKDMAFSIDMIWIDSDLKISHIEKSVSPETYPKIFKSEVKSLYVLEVSAGQSDILGLKIGDYVKFFEK